VVEPARVPTCPLIRSKRDEWSVNSPKALLAPHVVFMEKKKGGDYYTERGSGSDELARPFEDIGGGLSGTGSFGGAASSQDKEKKCLGFDGKTALRAEDQVNQLHRRERRG